MSPACACGKGKVVKRPGGWWCQYCHKTIRPSRKSVGAWERADAVAAYQREYRQRNKDAVAAYQREYRQRNKDAMAARKREYYQRNKDAVAAYQREYRQRNKDAVACAQCERPYYRTRGRPPRVLLCESCKRAAA